MVIEKLHPDITIIPGAKQFDTALLFKGYQSRPIFFGKNNILNGIKIVLFEKTDDSIHPMPD